MTVGIIITYIVLGILFALLFARSDYKDECEARDINMDDQALIPCRVSLPAVN